MIKCYICRRDTDWSWPMCIDCYSNICERTAVTEHSELSCWKDGRQKCECDCDDCLEARRYEDDWFVKGVKALEKSL
jgi:hypothetical protein